MERRSSLSNSGRRSRWGTFRTSFFGNGFRISALIYIYIYIFIIIIFLLYPFSVMIFVNLTLISFLEIFADKDHVSPKLSHTNVQALNYLLRSEIFVSEDG